MRAGGKFGNFGALANQSVLPQPSLPAVDYSERPGCWSGKGPLTLASSPSGIFLEFGDGCAVKPQSCHCAGWGTKGESFVRVRAYARAGGRWEGVSKEKTKSSQQNRTQGCVCLGTVLPPAPGTYRPAAAGPCAHSPWTGPVPTGPCPFPPARPAPTPPTSSAILLPELPNTAAPASPWSWPSASWDLGSWGRSWGALDGWLGVLTSRRGGSQAHM